LKICLNVTPKPFSVENGCTPLLLIPRPPPAR
jgi:hypothetical protein